MQGPREHRMQRHLYIMRAGQSHAVGESDATSFLVCSWSYCSVDELMQKPNSTATELYLFLCSGLQLEVVDMQAALGLLSLPCPATCALAGISVRRLDSAMPVTDTTVALVEKLVPWDIVLLDIPLHKVEVPREQRVQLQETCAVHLEGLQVRAIPSL